MATSAKKENRWKRTLYASNTAVSDRQREIEAATMERRPRPPCAAPKATISRSTVKRWLRTNAPGYTNATNLAEAANEEFDLPEGAMDDDTHWIWEEAAQAIDLS